MIGPFLLAIIAVFSAILPAAAADRPAEIEIAGSDLRIHTGDGQTIRGDALAGTVMAMLLDGRKLLNLRIDAVAKDRRAASDDVMLYDLSLQDAQGAWQPACKPDPFGEHYAILQPGESGALSVWCTYATNAKCVRAGYRPWATGPNGEPLRPYHIACSKMLRADYCGNDQATTRDGMKIELYDSLGIQKGPLENPELVFEAAWNEEGAICVAHPRVPQNISLERLAETCPRLKGRLGPICTEESAASFAKPLLFIGSRGDGITEAERGK